MHIHVHGFGFTGSGAVLDWMKDHPAVTVLPKIKGFMGGRSVAAILQAPPGSPTQREHAVALLEERQKQLDDRPLKTRLPGYEAGRAWANALKTHLGLGRRTGVHMTSTAIEGPEGWMLDCEYLSRFIAQIDGGEAGDPVAYWQGWFRARVAQYADGAAHVALDKCLPFDEPAHDGVWERVFEPARVVVAHRDPVDQCAEVVLRLGWDKLTRKGKYTAGDDPDTGRAFLARAEANLQRVLDYQRAHPQTCLAVPFEGFVTAHETWGAGLHQWLGVGGARPTPGPETHFDPAVSAENVDLGDRVPEARDLMTAHPEALERVRDLRRQLDALAGVTPA